MADTCVSPNLDMDSCEPKRLCCGGGVAKGYNQYGACPPNQGYEFNSETCQCCRPACQPRDYRVTVTFYRSHVNYSRCAVTGETCGYEPASVPGAQKTEIAIVNNTTPRLDIKEAGLIDLANCGCFAATNDDGWYRLHWDEDCPHAFDLGYSQIDWQGGARLGNEWSVSGTYYHTIDLVERYVSTGINQGYWEAVG